MIYIVVIPVVFILATLVGWLYGRNQIDPNTPEGMKHYSNKKES